MRTINLLDLDAARLAFLKKEATAFGHDRAQTIGASEIGGCARRVAYRKKGVPVDPDYKDDPGYAERGNILENHLSAPMMRAAIEGIGGKLLWAGQKDQTTFVADDWFMSATPDGLAIGVKKNALKKYGVKDCGDCFLVEFKSIDSRISLQKLPKDGHPEQVNYGLGLVRADGEYNPEYGLLLYTNCSSLSVHPFIIKFDPELFKRQRLKAKRIMTANRPEDLLPEGKMAGGNACKYCEFKARCQGRQK